MSSGYQKPGTIGELECDDEQCQPSPPDSDPHRVVHHVGVGLDEPAQPLPYCMYVRHQRIRQPALLPTGAP